MKAIDFADRKTSRLVSIVYSKGKTYSLRSCKHKCGCLFCTCDGFKFYGYCHHVDDFLREQQEQDAAVAEAELLDPDAEELRKVLSQQRVRHLKDELEWWRGGCLG